MNVPRKANGCIHNLTKYAFEFCDYSLQVDIFPFDMGILYHYFMSIYLLLMLNSIEILHFYVCCSLMCRIGVVLVVLDAFGTIWNRLEHNWTKEVAEILMP